MTADTLPQPTPVRTPTIRIVQGGLLCGGAAVLQVSAGADRVDFFWTPLIIGVTYLIAAVAGGPRGGYWATALGVTGWGLAVAYAGEARPLDIDFAGAYLVGVGLAGVAGALLRARGFVVSELGLGLTVVGAGLALALSPRSEALEEATTYAIALGALGALNVAVGAWQLARERGRAG